MRRRTFLSLSALAALPAAAESRPPDWRNIATGGVIPDEGYCDQPYVVILDDGSWLCTMTTGPGREGQGGQHVVSTVSSDQGRTWGKLVDIEPGDGPEASWVMPLKVPSGRVYAFYTYNKDNIRSIPSSTGRSERVDTLGVYAYKYTDDGGKTWSEERWEIPMRKMRIDRENYSRGDVMIFWGVGKPIIHGDLVYFGFAKVGRWGRPGTMIESQGCFMRSDNILTEPDPSKHRWDLLPDGDEGLRAPKGPVSDEANLVALSTGDLYATYRTIDGYNCHAYSSDSGQTWSGPEYATYAPGGRRIKHPRAANFVKKFSNGKYLLWYHNHGGEAVHRIENWSYYQERNPGWIAGGVEVDGKIHWSEPEILLYDDDPAVRISYPDFIEQDGRYWITATQKTVARVHEIDPALLEGVWNQRTNRTLTKAGLVANWSDRKNLAGKTIKVPALSLDPGFSLDMRLNLEELTAGQTILDTRDESGRGLVLETSPRFSLSLTLSDGERAATWESDPGTHEGTLGVDRTHHVVATVDGRSRIITWLIDGVLNDGGAVRQYGWGRVDPELGGLGGEAKVEAAPKIVGKLLSLRVYDRPLRTSEAVGNFRAG